MSQLLLPSSQNKLTINSAPSSSKCKTNKQKKKIEFFFTCLTWVYLGSFIKGVLIASVKVSRVLFKVRECKSILKLQPPVLLCSGHSRKVCVRVADLQWVGTADVKEKCCTWVFCTSLLTVAGCPPLFCTTLQVTGDHKRFC